MNNWPVVKIGEVLSLDLDRVEIDPTITYPMVGVYSFGRGLFDREPVHGGNTSYRNFYRLHAEHIVMSQLFGWEGALALSSTEFSSKFVSPQFPTFVANKEKLDRRYLGWYIRRPPFWAELGTRTRGMGDRRRTLNPEALLSCEIPLPPLSEQRRIVAKIEQLAAKIEEIGGFKEKAIDEAETLVPCALHEFFEIESRNWKQMPMTEAIVINDRQVDPTLPEYSRLPHISGENIESKTCKLLSYRSAEADGVKSANYLFFPNTILYSKIRPYLRKAVFVDFQGVCSADIYPIKLINGELEPQFLMWSLVAGPFTQYANLLSGRTRMPKLNRKQLFAFSLYYPTIDEQRRIVAYLDGLQVQVDRLKALQAQTAAELEALLPSILDKAFKGEL